MPPNRRHIWAGLYLPGIRSEGAGEIAIAVDCSGSINARQLGLFEAEIRSILEGQRPSRVHVLYFDTAVHRGEVYHAGGPIALSPVGGGGTNFAPCFRWLDERGIVPQTLVFLTDLCGAFPKEAPAYPSVVGINGVAPGTLRTSDSNGSGLTAASVSLGTPCNILGKDLRSGETEFDAHSDLLP
jgi:predicted metal-dependent peptidase